MFRKVRLWVLGLLLLLALLALLLPLALRSEPARAELAERLSYHLGSEISLDSVELAWLPTPHLLVRQVEVQRSELQLSLPQIHVFPSFQALLELRLEPRRVLLTDPTLRFVPSALLTTPSPLAPPASALHLFPRNFAGQVEIAGGTISIAETNLPGVIDLAETHFHAVAATVQINPRRLQAELSLAPSFGRRLTLEGDYTIDGAYNLQARGQGLLLHQLITTPIRGVAPLEAQANLSLTATGRGWEQFEADLSGDLPCFLLSPEELPLQAGTLRLDCGVIDLALHKDQDNWQLRLHDFEVKEPGMRLSGEITRQGRSTASPYWNVDLQGRELNVDQIMPAVLELFGAYRGVQKVGEIVLGGHVSHASWQLSGREDELRVPRTLGDRMILAMEVQQAAIMVPEIDLHLPEAAGSLRVENSILEISRAQARHGRSHGREGSLRVGLRRDLPVLELDLRLDADLDDLRLALPAMLDHPVFQEELRRFPRAAGEVAGHLVVSDNWHDFTVDVTIAQSHGEVIYDRLPWPLAVQRGRLLIDREEVRWQGLAATAGPHRLIDSDGRIAFGSKAPFVVEAAEAVIDSGAFYRHLLSYPRLRDALQPMLKDITGEIHLRRGRASGHLLQPTQWLYSATAEPGAGGVAWHSPRLATRVTNSRGQLLIDQERIDIRRLKVDLLADTFWLDGSLRHRALQNWRGRLAVNGPLSAAGRSWLAQRQWMPEFMLPRASSRLAPLIFAWDEDGRRLAGELQTGAVTEKDPPRLAFTLDHHRSNRQLNLQARLLDGARRADLQLELPAAVAGATGILPPLEVSFHGELAQGSLGRFFDFSQRHLETGSWQGDFHFTSTPAAAASFSGQLGVQQMSWKPDPEGEKQARLNRLSLSGEGRKWRVEELELELAADQQLSLSGAVTSDRELKLDLELKSALLRRQTLAEWQQLLKSRWPSAAGSDDSPLWPVQGRLAFQLAEFDAGPWRPEHDATALRWRPLVGELRLSPTTGVVAEIQTAELCCLQVGGRWYPDPARGRSSLTLASACPETTRFENVLSCLGIEQDIITGDCLLQAELHGNFTHWQQGRVSISSPAGGRILRMGLLSRLFSLVNLTDIFTGGITGLDERGFAYRELEFEALIEDHVLTIDRAVLRGEGLNLIARGQLELDGLEADMVILVAPFKTIDTLVSWIPFVGRLIGGEDATVVTIPVGLKGDIRDPQLTVMAPDAVGEGLLNLLRGTLRLPFNILSPLLPDTTTEETVERGEFGGDDERGETEPGEPGEPDLEPAPEPPIDQ